MTLIKDEMYEYLKEKLDERIEFLIQHPRQHGKSWLSDYYNFHHMMLNTKLDIPLILKKKKTEILKEFDKILEDIAG